MKDQYGNAVPADLVVLPDFWILTPEEVEKINDMDWYECKGVLLLSRDDYGGDDPQDVGLEVDPDGNLTAQVTKLDRACHRYSEADGFYIV